MSLYDTVKMAMSDPVNHHRELAPSDYNQAFNTNKFLQPKIPMKVKRELVVLNGVVKDRRKLQFKEIMSTTNKNQTQFGGVIQKAGRMTVRDNSVAVIENLKEQPDPNGTVWQRTKSTIRNSGLADTIKHDPGAPGQFAAQNLNAIAGLDIPIERELGLSPSAQRLTPARKLSASAKEQERLNKKIQNQNRAANRLPNIQRAKN